MTRMSYHPILDVAILAGIWLVWLARDVGTRRALLDGMNTTQAAETIVNQLGGYSPPSLNSLARVFPSADSINQSGCERSQESILVLASICPALIRHRIASQCHNLACLSVVLPAVLLLLPVLSVSKTPDLS